MLVDNVIVNVAVAVLSGIITASTLFISSVLLRHVWCDRLCTRAAPQFQRLTSSGHSATNTTTTVHVRRSHKRSLRTSKSGTTEIHCFFRYLAAVCCLLFCVVCIFVACNAVLFVVYNGALEMRLIAYVVWISYFLGRMLLNLLFVGRLYFTFRASAMAYSCCTMCVLCSLWCLMPCSAVLSIAMLAVRTLPIAYGIAVGTLFILIDILLSCLLLCLYLKKLHDLVVAQPHAKIIEVMTRYTLLYTICFCSSAVVFVLLAVAPVASPSINDSLSDKLHYQSFVWIVVASDSLLNTVCLWLNFAFAKKWYTMFCMRCHQQCGRCCNQCCTSKKMQLVEMDEFDPGTGTRVETETLKDSNEQTDTPTPDP